MKKNIQTLSKLLVLSFFVLSISNTQAFAVKMTPEERAAARAEQDRIRIEKRVQRRAERDAKHVTEIAKRRAERDAIRDAAIAAIRKQNDEMRAKQAADAAALKAQEEQEKKPKCNDDESSEENAQDLASIVADEEVDDASSIGSVSADCNDDDDGDAIPDQTGNPIDDALNYLAEEAAAPVGVEADNRDEPVATETVEEFTTVNLEDNATNTATEEAVLTPVAVAEETAVPVAVAEETAAPVAVAEETAAPVAVVEETAAPVAVAEETAATQIADATPDVASPLDCLSTVSDSTNFDDIELVEENEKRDIATLAAINPGFLDEVIDFATELKAQRTTNN